MIYCAVIAALGLNSVTNPEQQWHREKKVQFYSIKVFSLPFIFLLYGRREDILRFKCTFFGKYSKTRPICVPRCEVSMFKSNVGFTDNDHDVNLFTTTKILCMM